MAVDQAPEKWEEWAAWLAALIDGRSRWRLPLVLMGMLLASGRRTVTTWLRANLLQDDYRRYYYVLQTVGRAWSAIGRRLLTLVITQVLRDESRVLLAIDDTPTKRYGPKVQGARIHHDPTPGPAGNEFCYGHVWVTLAVALRHRSWGTFGLPIWSWLYIRQQDIGKLPKKYGWKFQTKLVQAADLALQAVQLLRAAGKIVWIVTDGGYTKSPYLRPLLKQGATLVGRLRKDAALRDLPPRVKRRGRGQPRKYGVNRISLAKRAGQTRGWTEVVCQVYGRDVVKRVKTFLATYPPFGGTIRVVIVKEETGPQFFYGTQLDAKPREIIEAFADRSSIEQVFHDLKEVWGAGQQQVRNLWSNIGVWQLNLVMHTLTELWAWRLPEQQLTRRADSPWDDSSRRPSHADRRKALQTQCVLGQCSSPAVARTLPKKIRQLTKCLLRLEI